MNISIEFQKIFLIFITIILLYLIIYIALADSLSKFMDSVCNIEIIKDGEEFVVRIQLANGTIREYRQKNLEDVLTEMVIAVQDELDE